MKMRHGLWSSAVLVALAMAACDPGAEQGEELEEVVEGDPIYETIEGALAAAAMTWSGSANTTLTFGYGNNSKSATQPAAGDINTAYKVLIGGLSGVTSLKVSASNAQPATSQASCAGSELSVRAWKRSSSGGAWTQVVQKDVKGAWVTTGGEFPTSYCAVSVAIPVTLPAYDVRVMTQGRQATTFNGIKVYSVKKASVSASGYKTPPNAGITLTVTSLAHSGGKWTGKVKNSGVNAASA